MAVQAKGERMNAPWRADFWADPLWQLMTNLGMLAALVAIISAVIYLWKRGPGLLVKYGGKTMTKMGHWWGGKRDG